MNESTLAPQATGSPATPRSALLDVWMAVWVTVVVGSTVELPCVSVAEVSVAEVMVERVLVSPVLGGLSLQKPSRALKAARSGS